MNIGHVDRGSVCGIVVVRRMPQAEFLELSMHVPAGVVIEPLISRSFVRPFTYHTAMLRRLARKSNEQVCLTNGFCALEDGSMASMVKRVFHKHAAIFVEPNAIFDWLNILALLAVHRVQQYPPALSASTVNITGHDSANYVFVGDRINPVFQHFNHWPWHAEAASARYLAETLRQINFNEADGIWTNINHPEQHVVELVRRRSRKIIALGRVASTGLNRQGIKHVMVPHPQYANRFLRNKSKSYASMLHDAIWPP